MFITVFITYLMNKLLTLLFNKFHCKGLQASLATLVLKISFLQLENKIHNLALPCNILYIRHKFGCLISPHKKRPSPSCVIKQRERSPEKKKESFV